MISKGFPKNLGLLLPVTSETNVMKVDSMETVNILHPIPCIKRNRDFLFLEDEETGETKVTKKFWAFFLVIPETSETNVTKADSMEIPI